MNGVQRDNATCRICGEDVIPSDAAMMLHLIQKHPLHFITSENAPKLFVAVSRQIKYAGEKLSRQLMQRIAK